MTCPLWGSSVQVDLCINHVVKSKDVRCGLSLCHEAWTWPCKNEHFLGPSNERSWLCTGLCHSAVCAWAVCLSFGKVALGFLCWFPVLWHDHDRDCVRGLCHSAVCAWTWPCKNEHYLGPSDERLWQGLGSRSFSVSNNFAQNLKCDTFFYRVRLLATVV